MQPDDGGRHIGRRPGLLSRPNNTHKATVARLAQFVPLVVVGATLFCAALGFTATRISKGRVEAELRATLQQALEESYAQFGGIDATDDVHLREIARRSRLADLRFDANPVGEPGRTLQSVHDPRGRIVGWFSWAGDHGFIAAMDRFWGFLALVGGTLAICIIIAMRAARHLLRPLNPGAADGRTLATRDPGPVDRTAQPTRDARATRRGVG